MGQRKFNKRSATLDGCGSKVSCGFESGISLYDLRICSKFRNPLFSRRKYIIFIRHSDYLTIEKFMLNCNICRQPDGTSVLKLHISSSPLVGQCKEELKYLWQLYDINLGIILVMNDEMN